MFVAHTRNPLTHSTSVKTWNKLRLTKTGLRNTSQQYRNALITNTRLTCERYTNNGNIHARPYCKWGTGKRGNKKMPSKRQTFISPTGKCLKQTRKLQNNYLATNKPFLTQYLFVSVPLPYSLPWLPFFSRIWYTELIKSSIRCWKNWWFFFPGRLQKRWLGQVLGA